MCKWGDLHLMWCINHTVEAVCNGTEKSEDGSNKDSGNSIEERKTDIEDHCGDVHKGEGDDEGNTDGVQENMPNHVRSRWIEDVCFRWADLLCSKSRV